MKQYLKGPHRRRHILKHALVIAAEHGYTNISQRAVAQAAGVASGLVPHYFTTMAGLSKAIMPQYMIGGAPGAGNTFYLFIDQPLGSFRA